MASAARRCVLALALASAAGASSLPAELIAGDDECDAGDDRCAFSALQLRARSGSAATQQVELEAGCHDAKEGEACFNELMWAKNEGMVNHPEWYAPAGLTPESSDADLQLFVHQSHPQTCPRPCSKPLPTPWCLLNAVAPTLWAPAQAAGVTSIKILSYNLFWWNLFGVRHGNGDSAGHLIKEFNEPSAFDVMGFQECEDPSRVLDPVGLNETFEAFLGQHAICMAYNKKVWTLLENGTVDVSEDMPTRYYGRRGAQWMRLQHKTTGQKLFFMNHHGPLSVNSGGRCGGQATAYNILQSMSRHAQVGDVLTLVGDFNANAASLTIQTLWSNLVQAFAGTSFGGVDNIFTNVGASSVTETHIMGSGGSDHDAIYAVVQVGEPEASTTRSRAAVLKGATPSPIRAAKELTGKAKPGHEWQEFWCGQIEDNTGYSFEPGFWNRSATGQAALDPEHCCRECQAIGADCQSWMWLDFSSVTGGRECRMNGNPSPRKKAIDGYVSGLAYTASAQHALQSAARALRSFDDRGEVQGSSDMR